MIPPISVKPVPEPHSNAKLALYGKEEVRKYASREYSTHRSEIAKTVYAVADALLKAPMQGLYWSFIASRKASTNPDAKGTHRGAGGVPKQFSVLKAIAWFGVTLVTLPLVLLGFLLKSVSRPGKDEDRVRFMDATTGPNFSYKPPVLSDDEKIHLATFNVGGLQPMVDAVKDVRPTAERMEELSEWINSQPEEDLPLGLGLQEMFDEKGAEILTNGIKQRYPYAVTAAGRSSIPVIGSRSGLQFHSRVPIIGAAFYGFEDLDGFGVRCSDRGFLRVELDLGKGKTALVYVTHTQPHVSDKHQQIRKQEIELIKLQMRYDRWQDSQKGIDRGGHYYLMGDLNVGNVDDEHAQDKDEKLRNIKEYDKLRAEGEVLHSASFFDPYLTEHTPEGERKEGIPLFLEKDVKNAEREKLRDKKWEVIHEPRGSFYSGADQADRLAQGYGTKHFYRGSHPVVENCRYDYILQLRHLDDLQDHTLAPEFTGKAEIRHVLPKGNRTTAISDHLMVSAIFQKVQPKKQA